jgi:hypothetical protein
MYVNDNGFKLLSVLHLRFDMLDENVMAAVLPTLPEGSVCIVKTAVHCSRQPSFNIKSKEATGKEHGCHCIS